ncbi:imidazole glycerol phosphate synthase subunit HisF [candidate division KSB1 bacterium]|nr:imidazole glycerol phosphate synthase subunit HisF [candidate division KSB1 bacterium]
MSAIRVIPCLDVDQGRVVKGIKFKELRDAGDPAELAKAYNDQGADELSFLDITASHESRDVMLNVVQQVSGQVFIPLTVGGGLRTVEDIRKVLNAGADKAAICTAALKNPNLLYESSRAFGSQCIVLSIDAKRAGDSYHCFTHGGRVDTGIDALEWAKKAEQLGAGEILLNSIDADGTKSGYELNLTRMISEAVSIPVIASGGAGNPQQILEGITRGKADAVLLASILHYGEITIKEIKQYLQKNGVFIRW